MKFCEIFEIMLVLNVGCESQVPFDKILNNSSSFSYKKKFKYVRFKIELNLPM